MSTTTESELVVSFVSDFMSSYAHIKNHKGRGTQIGSQYPNVKEYSYFIMCCSSDPNLCANCKAEPLSETECLSKGEVHPVRDTQRRPRPHTLPLDGRLGDVPILAALANQGTYLNCRLADSYAGILLN